MLYLEAVSSVLEGSTCPGTNGQYRRSSLYQPSGEHELQSVAHASPQTDLWSSSRLLSLRATHVPGNLNAGVDLLSRGAPMYREWSLHPEKIWARYG